MKHGKHALLGPGCAAVQLALLVLFPQRGGRTRLRLIRKETGFSYTNTYLRWNVPPDPSIPQLQSVLAQVTAIRQMPLVMK